MAVITSPKNCIVAGTESEICELKHKLDKNGIGSIQLIVSHAYHSYLMEEAATNEQKDTLLKRLKLTQLSGSVPVRTFL